MTDGEPLGPEAVSAHFGELRDARIAAMVEELNKWLLDHAVQLNYDGFADFEVSRDYNTVQIPEKFESDCRAEVQAIFERAGWKLEQAGSRCRISRPGAALPEPEPKPPEYYHAEHRPPHPHEIYQALNGLLSEREMEIVMRQLSEGRVDVRTWQGFTEAARLKLERLFHLARRPSDVYYGMPPVIEWNPPPIPLFDDPERIRKIIERAGDDAKKKNGKE